MLAQTTPRFFHSFDRDGVTVSGRVPIETLRQTAEIVFRHPVEGKTVLDVGAWDGFYSFEAEHRGAAYTLATDHFCWSGRGWGTKAGFDYLHDAIGSRVASQDVDVFGLDPFELGMFDIVLFLGVLYHLRDPFGGLGKVAAMCRDCLIVETHSDMNDVTEPVMRYYLGRELNGDGSNFWGPNAPCLEAMLQELGFKRFERHFSAPGKMSRLTLHAWR